MSFLKIHDNWPEWMIKWLERRVNENGGEYTPTPEDTARIMLGSALSSALAKKRDEEMLRALENGE